MDVTQLFQKHLCYCLLSSGVPFLEILLFMTRSVPTSSYVGALTAHLWAHFFFPPRKTLFFFLKKHFFLADYFGCFSQWMFLAPCLDILSVLDVIPLWKMIRLLPSALPHTRNVPSPRCAPPPVLVWWIPSICYNSVNVLPRQSRWKSIIPFSLE